jgi:predicted phosphoadenosine phosphosulfate sulfurtransferase
MKKTKPKKEIQQRIFATSDLLCEDLASKYDEVILSFSCGKDAIASMIQMKRFFKKTHLVFYYLVPNLDFQQKTIKYYEGIFEQKILQMPNPNVYNMLAGLTYQNVKSSEYLWENGFCDINFNYDDIFYMAKADLNIDYHSYTALGVRASDSLNRYVSIKKYGAVNPDRKQFFPIFDWSQSKVLTEIKQAKIKLPIDYKIWGRSFDGIDYRFLIGVKNYFPNDYEKIKQLFPLIDIEMLRYENQ